MKKQGVNKLEKPDKSWKFDSQVRRVGNGRKSTIKVEKREEKQCSITRPTTFADGKASSSPAKLDLVRIAQQGLPEHSFCIIALL